MKQKLFSLVLASALLTILSCGKLSNAQQEDQNALSEAKTFTATIENDAKTILDANRKVNWVSKDQVTIVDYVNNVSIYSAAPKDDATQAYFTFESGVAPVTSPYKAYYPSTIYSDGTLILPATQKYGSFALNPMYASSETVSLSFKNICSVIKLKTDISNVSSIELSTNDKNLSGTFTIDETQDFAMSMIGTEAADKKVTLSIETPNIVASEGYYYYYIAIPAQTYKNLTIKITAGGETKRMVKKLERSLKRNTIYNLTFTPGVPLTGAFTVDGNGKKVEFSSGNLYCERENTSSPWTWHIYDQQYMYNSQASASQKRSATEDDLRMEHFTWGYGSWSTDPVGYKSETTKANFVDWGQATELKADGWFTLSNNEWSYLIKSRTNASNLVKYGVTVCDRPNCLILAPDNYDYESNPLQSSYDEQAWAIAEEEGLVCLPAAGERNSSSIKDISIKGNYWTSTGLYDPGTGSAPNTSYFLQFYNEYGPVHNNVRSNAYSIRLVRLAE